jgi:hypothetical protein
LLFAQKKDGLAKANPSFHTYFGLFLPDAIKPQGRVTVAYAATVGTKTGI